MGFKDWVTKLRGNLPQQLKLGESAAFSSMEKIDAGTVKRTRIIDNSFDPLHESNLSGLSPDERMMLGRQKRQSLRRFSAGEPALGQNLITLWTGAINDRRAFQSAQDELSQFYIVDQILETLTEDTLNPNERGEIIEISSEREDIKDAADAFQKEHSLDNWLGQFLEDLLYMGEYTFRLETTQGVGVTSICDDVNQVGVLAMYERGIPSNFLVFMGQDYQIMPANYYAHFVLGSRKLRVRLDGAIDPDYQIDMANVDQEIRKQLPDYVRVGKPMFFRMVPKLRELQLLENLLIALKLNQITQSKVVAVRVPPSMTTEQVADVIRDLNEILNSQTGLDLTTGQVTIAEIMTQAGRFQAVPNYLDEKGAIIPLNIREDTNVDDLLATIDNMRQVILSSIGIPYSLIYGGEQSDEHGAHRANEIRKFGRYARKIGKLQWSLALGIKQILMVHFRNIGINCTFDEFDIVFKNSMTDVSGLEKMEFDDAKQEMVGRKLDFVAKMVATPGLSDQIHWPGVYEWLDTAFMDLTNGVPLFKFSAEAEDLLAAEEIQADDIDGLRDDFLTITAGQFAINRANRAAGNPVTDDEADLVSNNVEDLIAKVKSRFKANRARRNVINKDSSPEEVADFVAYSQDRFRKNRQRRDQQRKMAANGSEYDRFDE